MPAFPSKDFDAHHDYAYSVAFERDIHISEAIERGRKGYLCIGCKREMQAVIPKKQNVRRYFRHDAKYVKQGDKCTFKDEEYRHKLAITTLEINKEIRVPPVYKYPPKGVEGLALFLIQGGIVTATRVGKNVCFYEGANGEVLSTIHYNGTLEEVLFKADVVFYDENDEPVLFIQIGKRKKLKPEEFAGLKRLKVNTISLTVPKESAEAIEISQKKGDRAKWIYHDDEQQISYFSVPTDLGEGIPAIDGDENRLSVETFDCRKVQVNNLIRALSRCLESKPYLETERGVLEAIGKAELSIRRAEEQRAGLEEKFRDGVHRAHRTELDEIVERGVRLRTAKAGLNRRYKDLEERYQSKKRELTEEAQILEGNIRQEEIALGGSGKTDRQLRRELEREYEGLRSRIDSQFKRDSESIRSEQERVERAITHARNLVERIRADIASAGTDLERRQDSQRRNYKRAEDAERETIRDFEAQRDGRQEHLRTAGDAITTRFDSLRSEANEALAIRDVSGNTRFSKRLKLLSDARGLVLAIGNDKANIKRIKNAKRFLETAAFETWVSQYKS